MIVVYDELYTEHLRAIDHPESPDRVAHVARHLQKHGLFESRHAARDASDAEIERVHPHAYLERVKRDVAAVGTHTGYLSTGDTVIDESCARRRAPGGRRRDRGRRTGSYGRLRDVRSRAAARPSCGTRAWHGFLRFRQRRSRRARVRRGTRRPRLGGGF